MNRRIRIALIVSGVAASVALIVVVAFNVAVALQGWLTAIVWASMIPVGALTLLLIHRLTGGEWGFALAPVLEPAARGIAGVGLLFIPVLIFPHQIYSWQSSPDMPRQVAANYMNPPFFAFRTIAAFCVWSLLAWMPGLRRTATGAACGLIALAVIANVVAIDWIESTKPGYRSSSLGFGLWIEQILAALAFCAFVGTEGDEKRECRDLAGLLISALLGTMYFVYVEFAIIWYGNIPEKVAWFITRGRDPWPGIGGFALLIGAAAPFLALLNKEVRESETALRVIGGGMCIAIALHIAWLLVPSFGTVALLPAILGFVATGTAFALWIVRFTAYWPAAWRPNAPVQRHA
jgi:hypothetical protein